MEVSQDSESSTRATVTSDAQTELVPATSTISVQSVDSAQPPPLPQPPAEAPPSGEDGPAGSSGSGDAPRDSKPESAPSKSASLQLQIQALASLKSRVDRIRSLPVHLLIFHSQSPLISFAGLSGFGLGDGNGPSHSDTINSILNAEPGSQVTSHTQEMGQQARVAFRMLNEARGDLVKDPVQGALKGAHDSELQNKSDIIQNGRRTRKKRRIATTDSPAPFPSFHVETTRVFPPAKPEDRKIEDLSDLILFVQEYNCALDRRSRTKLAIWMPSRSKSGTSRYVSDPLTVRVTIRDVTTVFIKLRHPDQDRDIRRLCVESLVAFGPREKKGPYSHSDFTVYQKLTQHAARMIRKEPTVCFPQLVDLLASYEDLFITHCSVCRRMLPLEGHVPPVARVWKEGSITSTGERGRWEARHISCLHA